MALETETYSVDTVFCPAISLDVTTDTDTAQRIYTATIDIEEADPERTTTAEERVAGVTSLSPPTVRARSVKQLFESAHLACSSAIANTTGITWTPQMDVHLTVALTYGLQVVLREAGEDV